MLCSWPRRRTSRLEFMLMLFNFCAFFRFVFFIFAIFGIFHFFQHYTSLLYLLLDLLRTSWLDLERVSLRDCLEPDLVVIGWGCFSSFFLDVPEGILTSPTPTPNEKINPTPREREKNQCKNPIWKKQM